MEKEKQHIATPRIHLHDGYLGEPIWNQPENHSVYYNYEIDKQCRIPIRSRKELIKELKL